MTTESVDAFKPIGNVGLRHDSIGRLIVGQAPRITMHADREQELENGQTVPVGPLRPILDLQPTSIPLHKLLDGLLTQAVAGKITDIIGHVRVVYEESDAWAAGFFDGEGCVTALSSSNTAYKHYRLRLDVPQTRQMPVLIMQMMYGGTVRGRSVKGNRQPAWLWNATGLAAMRALQRMRPYLVRKAEVADLALAFGSRLNRAVRLTEVEESVREDLIAQIRWHNRRGRGSYSEEDHFVLTQAGLDALVGLRKGKVVAEG